MSYSPFEVSQGLYMYMYTYTYRHIIPTFRAEAECFMQVALMRGYVTLCISIYTYSHPHTWMTCTEFLCKES